MPRCQAYGIVARHNGDVRSYKYCPACDSVFPQSWFYKNKNKEDGLATYCRDCHARMSSGSTTARVLRERIVRKLGGACSRCCYSDDIRALQLDHVNGDGASHRVRDLGCSRKYYIQMEAELDSGAYQVLCSNCHSIKTHEDRHAVRAKVLEKRPNPLTGREPEIFLTEAERARHAAWQESANRLWSPHGSLTAFYRGSRTHASASTSRSTTSGSRSALRRSSPAAGGSGGRDGIIAAQGGNGTA